MNRFKRNTAHEQHLSIVVRTANYSVSDFLFSACDISVSATVYET